MPSLLTDQLNINILGAWNRAILTPDWLRQQFPDWFQEKQFEVQFRQGGSGLPIRFKFQRVILEPASNRLILRPIDSETGSLEFVGELGLAIFNKLEHTPILAVGHNVYYALDENESLVIQKFTDDRGLDEFYKSVELANRITIIRHTFSFENHNLTITYDGSTPKQQVAFNFHYDANSTAKIRHALTSFKVNYGRAQDYVRILIRGDK